MFNPATPFFYVLSYVVVLYLRPQEYVAALQGVPVVPVLLLGASGMWLLLQPKDFEAPQHGLMLMLALAISISVAMTGWGTGALMAFVAFVPTLLLFYVVATSVDSIQRFRQMALTMALVIVVIALHGIGQAQSADGVGWTGAKMIAGRITYLGLLNDPNDLSMVFLMTLPLMLYLARTTHSWLLGLGLWTGAGAVLYAVYLCNSRGAVLGLGAMVFVYAVRRFGWVGSLLASPLLLVPFLLLAPSRVGDMSADESSAAGRLDAWYAGLEMLKAHPVFGVGTGMFIDHHELTAHNSFVLAFAEMGLVGYFFWLSLLVVTAVMLQRLLRLPAPADSAQAEIQPAAVALMYALVGTLVTAFFLSRTYVAFLYHLLALIVAVFGIARAQWPEQLPPVQFGELTPSILLLAVSSIAGIWVLTKVLL